MHLNVFFWAMSHIDWSVTKTNSETLGTPPTRSLHSQNWIREVPNFPLAQYIDCKSSTLGKWCYWKHLRKHIGNMMRTIWKLDGKTLGTSKFKIPLPKQKKILILWIAMSHQPIGHGGNTFKTSSSKESKPHLAQGRKPKHL